MITSRPKGGCFGYQIKRLNIIKQFVAVLNVLF